MKGKRLIALGLLLVLGLGLLAGCTNSARPLPEGMDEETTGEAGRQIMMLLVEGKYQEVADAFRPDMKEAHSVDAAAVEAIVGEILKEAGPLVQVNKTVAVGARSKGFDEDYASVVVAAQHENKLVFYELSFDKELQLMGLGLKKSKR